MASEIDKYAIKVTQANYPNTIQLGCVKDIDINALHEIDLLIGGSPCQGFSFAGKQLNFDDPRSKLFFEYVRILEAIKPKYFLLENVKMKKEFQDIISKILGVQPVEINSALVSAQNRKRLYWTNIANVVLPVDKGIMLKDIVHENCFVDRDKSHAIIASIGRTTTREYFKKNQGQMAYHPLNEYIVPFDKALQILDKEVEKGKVGYFRKDSQANRVYYIHDKAITLCGGRGGGAAKMGQYLFGIVNKPHGFNKGGLKKDKSPSLTKSAWEQNNHLLFGCITLSYLNKGQNGQRFSEGKKFYTLTAKDKHGILVEGYIRKLTPIECERLQTVPDNYTNHVSNTQRYKMLGNGWTIDVIVHILNGIKR